MTTEIDDGELVMIRGLSSRSIINMNLSIYTWYLIWLFFHSVVMLNWLLSPEIMSTCYIENNKVHTQSLVTII